jgi:hypothetical protein
MEQVNTPAGWSSRGRGVRLSYRNADFLLVFLSLSSLARQTGHHGRVLEVDDDQLAALRRLGSPSAPSRSSRSFAMTKSLAMTQKMLGRGTGGCSRGRSALRGRCCC